MSEKLQLYASITTDGYPSVEKAETTGRWKIKTRYSGNIILSKDLYLEVILIQKESIPKLKRTFPFLHLVKEEINRTILWCSDDMLEFRTVVEDRDSKIFECGENNES